MTEKTGKERKTRMDIDKNTMLAKIGRFAEKRTAEEKKKTEAEKRAYDEAKAALEAPEMKARIGTLLEIANAAQKAGIDIHKFYTYGKDDRIGFIQPDGDGDITHCGIAVHDACSSTELWVGPDGAKGVQRGFLNGMPEYGERRADTGRMERFALKLPKFEAAFVRYLDETCQK